MMIGLLRVVAAVAAMASGVADPAGVPTRAEPCDGPDASAWAAAFRDRMLAYDGLARFAVAEFGAPVACDGTVTGDFDGAVYGTLVLTFAQGVTVEASTQPPESSVVFLRAASGFGSAERVRELLLTTAAEMGLRIDWSAAPEVTLEGDERVERYWDPDPGLNASAALVFRVGVLVAVGLGLAL
jgi:hypothetical protein